jgi:protein-S-isoprenylcysteine O-methyltransferase Ste14
MVATIFEFKYRDIIIRLIYLAAVLCYAFDSDMTGSLMGGWLFAWTGAFDDVVWTRIALFVGVALVFAAGWIRSWATSYLRYDIMRNPRIHTDRLICDGPFRYLRNPLYLGNLLMVAGVTPMLPRTGVVVLVAGSVLFVSRLVMREEMEMQQTHGESFLEYCRTVPRWLPSTRRSEKSTMYTPSFVNGVLGELLLWIIALAMAAYAATFDIRIFAAIFFCAFIPGASRRMQRLRRRAHDTAR